MTPVEIISTSVAGVALIIAWLARVDSKKSAGASEKSAAAAERSAVAAERANELIARQLELAKSEQEAKLKKAREEDVPRLMCRTPRISSGDSSMNYCAVEFENLGGDLLHPTVKTVDGVRAQAERPLLRNRCAKIVFATHPKFPLPFCFTIQGTTSTGAEFSSKEFRISGVENCPTCVEEMTA